MRRVIAVAAALVVAAWLVVVAGVVLMAGHDAAAPADAIVVLGAAQYNGHPSPVFPRAARSRRGAVPARPGEPPPRDRRRRRGDTVSEAWSAGAT